MIPIPKPKFFERKVPAGQSESDYFREIIYRQTHILGDAVDRVSGIPGCKFSIVQIHQNVFKLIYPSVLDPAGILMLRSVRIVFEKIGIQPETMTFEKERFDSTNLVKALNENPKKCPAIVTMNLFGDRSPHVMVAINALQGKDFTHEPHLGEKWFINCKNSYRDDKTEPGIF